MSEMSLSDQQVIIGFAIFIVSMIVSAFIFRTNSGKDNV